MEEQKGRYVRENVAGNLPAGEAEACAAYAADYAGYLGIAKTERRAYAEAVRRIEAQGFRELGAFETLRPGDKVYRGYHGKTLMAAVIGREPVASGLRVIGGHTDAPRIDLKPVPLCEKGGLAFFDTHYYGGIKKYQWVAQPLSLHGVIVKKDGTAVKVSIGEDADDPVFVITDLLIHLAQEQMEKKASKVIEGEKLDLLIANRPLEEAAGDEK